MAEDLEIPVQAETDSQNDPLGILKPQKQTVSGDPLGILKKKVGGEDSANGTQNGSQSKLISDLYSLASKIDKEGIQNNGQSQAVNKIPMQHIAGSQAIEPNLQTPINLPKSDEQEYQTKLNTQKAVINTLKQKKGKSFDENSPSGQKDVQDYLDKIKNNDLAVVPGKDGKDYVTRGQGFAESLWESMLGSVYESVDAAKINAISDPTDPIAANKLAALFNQKQNTENNIPESAPAGFGKLGEQIGGVPKMAAEAAIPYVGEALMAADAYQTERVKKMKEEYKMGKSLGLSDVEAAQKAMNTSLISAIPSAVTAVALNRLGGSAATGAAENTLKNTLIHAMGSVPKVGAIFSGSQLGSDLTELAAGYKKTPTEIAENAINSFGQGAMMDLGFNVMKLGAQVPGYLKAAAKNLLVNAPKDVVDAKLADMGAEGQSIRQELDSYKNAAQKVQGLVPEEHLPNIAGNIEKQDAIKKQITELEAKKAEIPKELHGKIDEQISYLQSQSDEIGKTIGKMTKSDNPLELEKDNVTGLKGSDIESINKSNNKYNGFFTTLQQMQNESRQAVGAEAMQDLPQRIYEGLSKEIPNGNERNSEIQSKLQGAIKDVFGGGDDTERTLRNMSEPELRNASRRLYESIGSEMAMSQTPQTLPSQGELGKKPIEGEQNKNEIRTTANTNGGDESTTISNTKRSSNNLGEGKVKPIEITGTKVFEHGEDDNTAEGLENGVKPTDLTDKGSKEAESIGNFIKDNQPETTRVEHSDVKRAKETGEEVAKTAGIESVPNPVYRTADIGNFDGKPEGTFDEKGWTEGKYDDNKTVEPFQTFTDRMEKAYDHTKNEIGKETVVITHSKVTRALEALEKTDGKWTDETTKDFLKLKEKSPNTIKAEVTIPIKVDGNSMDAKYISEYKGKKIVEIDGNIHVYDPKKETLFNVALDDSKTSGGKKINKEANNVESAKKYIDWADKTHSENIKPIQINETTKDPNQTETTGEQPKELIENKPTAKSNKGVIKKAQSIEDLTEPRDIVLQHFVGGGKIHSDAIKDIFGGKDDRLRQNSSTENEKRARIGLLGKDAKGIDELAHNLWENDKTEKYTTQDYKEAIEQVIQDHNSPSSMAKELVDKYIDKAVRQEFTDKESKEISDNLIKQIHDQVENLPESVQKELTDLLSKYQDKHGFIDWEKLNEDTNGFDPQILNLSENTQKHLYELINEKLTEPSESDNITYKNETESKKGEKSTEPTTEEKISELEKERDSKLEEVGKPDIKLELVSGKDLATKGNDPLANKQEHDKIKDDYKSLKALIDCLWT